MGCRGCGAGRLDPFPTDEDAKSIYGPGYFAGGSNGGYTDYDADGGIHRRNGRRRLRLLGEKAGSLIDVGCASGYFLVEARLAGWDVLGVDVSPTARERAARDFRLAVKGSLEDVPDASADAITFFQSLEHMIDPLSALCHARRVLRPGGVVVIETWDRRSLTARLMGSAWQQLTPPSVLWLFDRTSLVTLSEGAGLALRSLRPTFKWVSAATVTGVLAAKSDRLRTAMGWPLVRRAGRLPVPYFLDDLVTSVSVAPTPRQAAASR